MGLVYDWRELRNQHPNLHIEIDKHPHLRVDEVDFKLKVCLAKGTLGPPWKEFWIQTRGPMAKLEEGEVWFPNQWLDMRLREKLKAIEAALRLGAA